MGNAIKGQCWRELSIYLAAYSGLRIGELLALERADVSTKGIRRIHVQRQYAEVRGKAIEKALPK